MPIVVCIFPEWRFGHVLERAKLLILIIKPRPHICKPYPRMKLILFDVHYLESQTV